MPSLFSVKYRVPLLYFLLLLILLVQLPTWMSVFRYVAQHVRCILPFFLAQLYLVVFTRVVEFASLLG